MMPSSQNIKSTQQQQLSSVQGQVVDPARFYYFTSSKQYLESNGLMRETFITEEEKSLKIKTK